MFLEYLPVFSHRLDWKVCGILKCLAGCGSWKLLYMGLFVWLTGSWMKYHRVITFQQNFLSGWHRSLEENKTRDIFGKCLGMGWSYYGNGGHGSKECVLKEYRVVSQLNNFG